MNKLKDVPYYIDDNFVPLEIQNKLEFSILNDEQDFPWYYNEDVVYDNDNQYQFTHAIHTCKGISPQNDIDYTSPYFDFFKPFVYKLGIRKPLKIKLNLRPRTLVHRKTGYHIDIEKGVLGVGEGKNTAIFYMNTCNGWTEFKKGGKVKSVANRMVIFDSNLEHRGVTCTDEKRRVVINFNYDVWAL